jgi:hypothetical protein
MVRGPVVVLDLLRARFRFTDAPVLLHAAGRGRFDWMREKKCG